MKNIGFMPSIGVSQKIGESLMGREDHENEGLDMTCEIE
jgi:hypothetical protein